MADATIRGKLGSYNGGTSIMVVSVPTDGTAPQVGDWMLVLIIDTGAVATTITPPTPPSGAAWTVLQARVAMGSRYYTLYGKRRVSGEGNYTFTASASSAQNAAIIYGPGGEPDPANWFKTAFTKTSTSVASFALPAPATQTVKTLQVALWGVAVTNASETDAQNTVSGTGWNKELWSAVAASGTSTNKEFIASYSQPANAAGVSPTHARPTATLNFSGIVIGIPSTVVVTPKLAAKWWDGSSLKNAYMSWWDGSTVRELAQAVRIWPGKKGRQKFSGATPLIIAHRAGSKNYMEHTLRGATQSAIKNVGAIEISVACTSDGVIFGLHDADLNRTTPSLGATSVLASSQTWAQVSALQQTAPVGNDSTYGAGPYPYYKLSDFLDAYASSHTIFVDPKVLTSAQRQQLYAQLLTYTDPYNTFVIKYFHTGTSVAAEARTLGFKSWGYGYQGDIDGTNSPQMTTTAPLWDYVGMEYGATDAAWAATVALNKPIIGHIAPDWLSAQKCLTRGAVGVMSSGVNEVMAGVTSGVLTSDAFATTGPLSSTTWTKTLDAAATATVTAAGNMALTNDSQGRHQASFMAKTMAPRQDSEMTGTFKFTDLQEAVLQLIVRGVSPVTTYYPIGYYLSVTPDSAAGSNVTWRVGSSQGYDYATEVVTSATLTMDASIKYAYRVRVDGILLRAKIWDATTAEPDGWMWVSKIGQYDFTAVGVCGVQLVSGMANNPTVNFGPITITDGRRTGGYEHAPVLGSSDTFNGRTLTTTYVEKFDRDCALGDFKKVYTEMEYYDTIRDNFPDTSGMGDWDVTSTLSVSDGLLDIWLHTASDGRPKVACIIPENYKPHLFGRWKIRYRCQQDLPGYKFVGLLWPKSDLWNDGEIDWPEGNLSGNVRPASAIPGSLGTGSNGGPQFLPPTEMFGLQTTKEFHTFTMDWTSTQISFLMDDVLVGTVTGASNIPQIAMRLTLQAETWLGEGAVPAGTSGHMKIDWLAVMD